MSIQGIPAGPSPMSTMPAGGGNASSQIKTLEQRLSQLNSEKEKALKAKDDEAAKRIAMQIQDIQRQIAQLKNQEGKKAEKEESPAEKPSEIPDPLLGKYVDEKR